MVVGRVRVAMVVLVSKVSFTQPIRPQVSVEMETLDLPLEIIARLQVAAIPAHCLI